MDITEEQIDRVLDALEAASTKALESGGVLFESTARYEIVTRMPTLVLCALGACAMLLLMALMVRYVVVNWRTGAMKADDVALIAPLAALPAMLAIFLMVIAVSTLNTILGFWLAPEYAVFKELVGLVR